MNKSAMVRQVMLRADDPDVGKIWTHVYFDIPHDTPGAEDLAQGFVRYFRSTAVGPHCIAKKGDGSTTVDLRFRDGISDERLRMCMELAGRYIGHMPSTWGGAYTVAGTDESQNTESPF
jgi:hypothetical protein